MSEKAIRALRALNFAELISFDIPDAESYSFHDYRTNGFRHPMALGCCIACEQAGHHRATDGSGFRLNNISHGAHSGDFLDSLDTVPATSGWHHDPVLFVFEGPSKDYGQYGALDTKGYAKRPSREWYWVHRAHRHLGYPDSFCGGTYGDLVRSVILTFRLANAYVTNLVKCGLNDFSGGQYRGIGSYPPECISTCFQRFLSREVAALQPKVVFAFGTAVENALKQFLGNTIPIQQLPHPAGQRRGFRDEYYETLYFWLMSRALVRVGVLAEDAALELGRHFLSRTAVTG